MTTQWVLENYKPYIIMAEGPYATLYWAQFLETDIRTINLSLVFKYFSVNKYVTKRVCQNNC